MNKFLFSLWIVWFQLFNGDTDCTENKELSFLSSAEEIHEEKIVWDCFPAEIIATIFTKSDFFSGIVLSQVDKRTYNIFMDQNEEMYQKYKDISEKLNTLNSAKEVLKGKRGFSLPLSSFDLRGEVNEALKEIESLTKEWQLHFQERRNDITHEKTLEFYTEVLKVWNRWGRIADQLIC